jgi:hypothetical protein
MLSFKNFNTRVVASEKKEEFPPKIYEEIFLQNIRLYAIDSQISIGLLEPFRY